MKTYAIIPAGGSGSRIGTAMPKQFIEINGREIIAYTLQVFNSSSLIDEIVVSTRVEYFEKIEKIKTENGFNKITAIVEGGAERQDSVFNGLKQLKCSADDLVAVHDAARPLLPQAVLTEAILKAKETQSIVVAIKAKDTLLKGAEKVDEYVDRENLYYAQTPQIFSYEILKTAFEKAASSRLTFTDESSIVLNAGHPVNIVEGSAFNFKVTTPDDVNFIKSILS